MFAYFLGDAFRDGHDNLQFSNWRLARVTQAFHKSLTAGVGPASTVDSFCKFILGDIRHAVDFSFLDDIIELEFGLHFKELQGFVSQLLNFGSKGLYLLVFSGLNDVAEEFLYFGLLEQKRHYQVVDILVLEEVTVNGGVHSL